METLETEPLEVEALVQVLPCGVGERVRGLAHVLPVEALQVDVRRLDAQPVHALSLVVLQEDA